MDGHLDDEAIRGLLLAASKDPSDGLRQETIALLTTRPQAVDVRDALVYTVRNDRNAGVRLKALEGLQAFIGEPDVRGALADVLSSDANPAMRMGAIDLLMQGLDAGQSRTPADIVDPRMVGVLQELISREENPYMRQKCQRALELVKASAEVF
ncbi:MAG: HEAT repeat domain-containing protein [Acidobacteriota bacterium]